MKRGTPTSELVRLTAAASVVSLLLAGCAGKASVSDPEEFRTGAPVDHSESEVRVNGTPADAHGTLRVKQIRHHLLTEDEMFVRSDGHVEDYVEAETVLHRWKDGLIPDDAAATTPCTQALADLYTATQENTLLALMLVHGQTENEDQTENQQQGPADLAVGIASYQQPAQVQPEWEVVAEDCDGEVVVLSGQQYEARAFLHSEAAGLSLMGADSEHHILGVDSGHNAITVYAETSRDHARALLDSQLAKLGIE